MSRPTAAPPRHPARRRPALWGPGGAVWLLAAALAACGAGGGPDGEPAGAEGPPVDSVLVDVLAEVALAEARAALSADSSGRGGATDSLRAVALGAHGLDPDGLDRRLDALARDPELAEATYAAVADRLRRERRGADDDAPL